MASGDVLLSVSTKKGVFLVRGDSRRESWALEGPFLAGEDVNHTTRDDRTGKILATANNPWFGPSVKVSSGNDTWTDTKSSPRFKGDPTITEAPQDFASSWFAQENKILDRLWCIRPGRDSEPNVIHCGVAPAALFTSTDGGATWTENAALSNHETRSGWQPGAGGLALHSIVLDPKNANRMWIAISAAGVFRTDDGGKTWQTKSQGIRSEASMYDPNIPPLPEWGQCVHRIGMAGGSATRIYAQSHLGTYRSEDGGDSWVDITAGLPSDFALGMTPHPHDPDTIYTVPLQSGEFRCPPDHKLRVFRTRDAGKSWQGMTKGLPQENAYMGVYRGAMCTDSLQPAGVYFGTNTGQLYASRDDGESWSPITQTLPPISAVSASVL